ncbi:MAG TPA: hypothetical protein VM491_24005, partial [Burkholderiaceae bacterium]|nr:hypothetical protein [Burkholderiaceae bacterium]
EKSPATADCAVAADDRTLATGVSAFSFVQYQPAAMLSARVVEAAVTIGSGADAVGVAVKGRLGGASP